MKTDVYNVKNEVVKTIEVSEKVFGVAWKPALVHQVLLAQAANARRPWAHAKGRSEVRGGGRKPRPQKGSGRSRQGSIRSPIWAGGGVSHGPNKERDYSQKVNKKMKKVALLSMLTRKLKEHNVKIFDTLSLAEAKTKLFVSQIKPLLSLGPKAKKFDVLVIPAPEEKNLFRAARNVPKTKVLEAGSLNIYDLVNYGHVFIDERALPVIEKQYALR